MRKWLPYSDPTRMDVWTDVSGAIPTPNGTYRSAPGFYGTGSAVAGGSSTKNAFQGALPDGSFTNVAGGSQRLYTWSAATFTDRSLGATDYSASTHWSFAQYGIYTLATNGINQIQVRDATGVAAFANLGGTPPTTAKYLVVQSNVVLAFNTNTGGQYWAASDVGNHANWTTGEAASGPINHRPGAITGAVAFRDEVIVFKADSMYRMRYVGSPIYWTVELISDTHGAKGPGSIVNCGNFLAVLDRENAYLFDGSSFKQFDDDIRAYLYGQSVSTPIAAQYFRAQETIYWNILAAKIVAYNVRSDAWGKFDAQQPASEANTPTHILMTGSGLYDCMRSVTMIQVTNADPVLTSFPEDEVAGSANTALDGAVETGLFGAYGQTTLIDRVTPMLKPPSGGSSDPAAAAMTCTPSYYASPAGAPTARSAVACSTAGEKRFDLIGSGAAAAWQKFRITFTNTPWEIDDVIVREKPAGVAP